MVANSAQTVPLAFRLFRPRRQHMQIGLCRSQAFDDFGPEISSRIFRCVYIFRQNKKFIPRHVLSRTHEYFFHTTRFT